jgi:hypothetical protein
MNSKKVLSGFFIFLIFLAKISLMFGEVPTSMNEPFMITVTNVSDVVNGDIMSVVALISNPGSDGISFREALYAANNTTGQKTIQFDPSMSGDTITFAADGDVLLLSSGELKIDGDINGDGNQDITFDGHLGQSGSLWIVSSDNTITGLNSFDVAGVAISIACPDSTCGTKLFANNKIINNTISTQRGNAIVIGTLGLRPVEEVMQLSNITWSGTIISGNTINTKDQAMFICPGVGGEDQNKIINLTISNNHFSCEAELTMGISAADVNSAWFGIPGPIDYSDYNLIDSLTIINNHIDAPYGFGIYILCANAGNSKNKVQNVKIKNNTITNSNKVAIFLNSGDAGDNEKLTNSNLITNVEITKNTISQIWQGISIEGGHQGSGIGANNNKLENVLIAENEISEFTLSGISIVGGSSNSSTVTDNILDSVIIVDNHIYQTENHGGWGAISIFGGKNANSSRNHVKEIHIRNNQITNCGTGIMLIGGEGIDAKDNQVSIAEMNENILFSNTTSFYIQNNISGATNNCCTPSITSTKDASRCGTGTVTIGATSCFGTINWYSTSTGGTSIGTDTSFTTPSIDSTTVYYIDATNSGCTTATRTEVTATIDTIPTITGTTDNSFCGSGTVTLGATASSGIINWYLASTGDTSLGAGPIFITPSLTSTTIYYIDATNKHCTSTTRTAVTAKDTCTTGVKNLLSPDNIRVYPIPTSGLVEIAINEPIDSGYTLELFNSLGAIKQKILINKNAKVTQIDLSGYSAGLYLMRFNTKKGFFDYKILKE